MDADKINIIIALKTQDLKARLQSSIRSYNMQHVNTSENPTPLTNISTRISQQFGVSNRIRIKFKRSGVFVHKGVGRNKKDGSKSNRQAKEWFNPVVEQFADELASEVADEYIEIAIN